MVAMRIGIVTALLSVAGCAGTPGGDPPPAATGQEALCMNLLRDMRQYCRQGIRDERATTGVDCLSRRLEFERRCL